MTAMACACPPGWPVTVAEPRGYPNDPPFTRRLHVCGDGPRKEAVGTPGPPRRPAAAPSAAEPARTARHRHHDRAECDVLDTPERRSLRSLRANAARRLRPRWE